MDKFEIKLIAIKIVGDKDPYQFIFRRGINYYTYRPPILYATSSGAVHTIMQLFPDARIYDVA